MNRQELQDLLFIKNPYSDFNTITGRKHSNVSKRLDRRIAAKRRKKKRNHIRKYR